MVQAQPITDIVVGVPIAATLSQDGGQQYYRVPVGPGEHLVVLLHKASKSSSRLDLKFGALPTDADSDATDGDVNDTTDQAVEVAATQGGEYFVRARAECCYAPGSYTLIAHTLATLPTLTPGLAVEGTLTRPDGSAGAEQYYRVAVGPGEHLVVLLHKASKSSSRLDLKFGALPTDADSDATDGDVNDTTDQAVEARATQSGEYFVRVRAEPSYTPGSYTLIAHTLATLPTLTPGLAVEGTLTRPDGSAGAEQYYRVAVGPGEHLVVLLHKASKSSSRLDLKFGALPTDADHDASDGGVNDTRDQRVEVIAARAGDYFVRVTAECCYAPGPYTVTAQLPSRISPNHGGNAGQATVTIRGQQFDAGVDVSLRRIGEIDIPGMGIVVSPDRTYLVTTFDLTGRATGVWDVVVTGIDGVPVTIPGGFNIEQGGSSQVWVDIIGRDRIRVGRQETFTIIFGNRGNVDAFGVPVWIGGIPKNATWDLGFKIKPPPPSAPGVPATSSSINWDAVPVHIETETEIVLPLLVPFIPVGQTGVLTITLAVPTNQDFQLRSWSNPPLSRSAPNALFLECGLSFVKEGLTLLGISLPPGAPCATAAALWLSHLIIQAGEEGYSAWRHTFDVTAAIVSLAQLHVDVGVLILDCLGREWAGRLIDVANAVLGGFEIGKDCLGPIVTEALLSVQTVRAIDPNDKTGSHGFGQERYVSGDEPLRYVIFFENVETATAAAQRVVVTDRLDSNVVDLFSFRLGSISFGDVTVTSGSGSTSYSTDVDLRPKKDLVVRVNAAISLDTGLVSWRLQSIDPSTGQPPEDPVAGFLAPNRNPPEGQGSVLFTVMPKAGLPRRTEIINRATVFFDDNPGIETVGWLNGLDNTNPASHVLPLEAVQRSEHFEVRWSGSDDGAGIRDYTILVSENGRAFVPWLTNTTAMSGTFDARNGVQYAFYSIAQDGVGNIEAVPNEPDAVTTVALTTTTTTTIPGNGVPACSAAAASPAVLWPPNHRFVNVSVAGVTDPDGDPVAVTITRITQDEVLTGGGEGNTCPDASGVGTATASLRAEREGGGDGRVYHVGFTADDGRNGRCTGTVTVCVPHDQGQRQACGDQGPLVDSTGPTCVGACRSGCAIEMALAQPLCPGENIPAALVQRLNEAQQLISRAAGTSGKQKAKKLMRRGVKVLKQAVRLAAKAAKKGTISPACAASIATEFGNVKTGADRWLDAR